MKVVDPGHLYTLASLDGDYPQALRFVKRVGEKYPGNIGAYSGTTMQEVFRALHERASYVNTQAPSAETAAVRDLCALAIFLLEDRAVKKHGKLLIAASVERVMELPTCNICNHVMCEHAQ